MVKDKVVVITGASSGIGYATALALAKAGAKVAAGARRVDKLEFLQKEIHESDGEILIEKLEHVQNHCSDGCFAVTAANDYASLIF